ncbi:MAG: 4Fe-4S binding protein [Actinobacteria bacterium]|nr:4Fe-4S binding protein [Actinomycetota bacterium]
MALYIDTAVCIGCGACEYGCPTDAILKTDSQLGVFIIETHLCNDCGWCPTVCPVDCMLPEPESIVCQGRGCPVAPGAKGPFAGWDCTLLTEFCDRCGNVKWAEPGTGAFVCARCDLGQEQRWCPKIQSYRKGRIGQRLPKGTPVRLGMRHGDVDLGAAPREITVDVRTMSTVPDRERG